MESAPEYRKMLVDLLADGLPRFEARFKELLNENTIREIANFQSQLHLERQSIRERIEKINGSLHEIDYNPNRSSSSTPNRAWILKSATSSRISARVRRERSRGRRNWSIPRRNSCRSSELSTGSADAKARAIWTSAGPAKSPTCATGLFFRRPNAGATTSASTNITPIPEASRADKRKNSPIPSWLPASPTSSDWNGARRDPVHFVSCRSTKPLAAARTNSTRYGLELFRRLCLQLLIVTPLQKIHVIEPYIASVGFVHNDDGSRSMLRNLTIEEYRAEQMRRAG